MAPSTSPVPARGAAHLAPILNSPSPSTAASSSNQPEELLLPRLLTVLSRTWDLGLTAFGGPPVHFQILHSRFVTGHPNRPSTQWLSEQDFAELFAVSQSLPGPASTKMLFNIALLRGGLLAGFLTFLAWSLPVAVGMYGLALGVEGIRERLPGLVYALLSGLNAATVGVVALAAVQLASKAITDRLTRGLVVWGACAGVCYSALWYFPVVIVTGGAICGVWDVWARAKLERFKLRLRRKWRGDARDGAAEEAADVRAERVEMTARESQTGGDVQRRRRAKEQTDEVAETSHEAETRAPQQSTVAEEQQERAHTHHSISIPTGIGFIALTFAIFIALALSRSLLPSPSRPLSLLANMYQAGILIFGGGPVVIPLLREYVVQPGWVSSRDFLLGLAIIQAMPGPNFNFSVYLGALAMAGTSNHSLFGAVLSFVGIFAPGLLLMLGVQGLWVYMRTKPAVLSVLRGINATAVGLVFTAVYRLWEIGYLTPENNQGMSLGQEPWWVVVVALTYCEVAWYGIPPPVAIVFGAVLGMGWYGAVGRDQTAMSDSS